MSASDSFGKRGPVALRLFTMGTSANRSKAPVSMLDGRKARLAALGVFLGVLLAAGYIHRAAILPAAAPEVAADDPVALCLAERAKGIDEMVTQGTISTAQAAQFKGRAEALCVSQHGPGNGPPPRQ